MISSVERHILVPALAVAFFFCRTLECLAAGVMPSGRSAAEGGDYSRLKSPGFPGAFPAARSLSVSFFPYLAYLNTPERSAVEYTRYIPFRTGYLLSGNADSRITGFVLSCPGSPDRLQTAGSL